MGGGSISRRAVLAAGGALVAAPGLARLAHPGTPFSWEWLKARALQIAARPYAAPPPPPAAAHAIDYDTLNSIAYRPEHMLWGTEGRPGVRLFPLSRMSPQRVDVALVENGRAQPLAFEPALFAGAERIPTGAEGFSGFRVMAPQGDSDWLAFQGASYFRAAGALDQYGLSARALAINTGAAMAEEFPRFTHFWLEAAPAGALTIYALLDSPSVAGAWRFVCRQGPEGVTQDVSFVLQLRRPVDRLGLAPLTSMFWYGEGNRAQATDWRPEIHDSDGLAMLTGAGERIWRPLDNPAHAITNSFADDRPRGFGLLQRDRAVDHYQDDGVFYERRPNLWIEPLGDWSRGAVMLVELPTVSEVEDNIVAFWRPAAPPPVGRPLALSYRMRWSADEPGDAARVAACWRGTAGPPGSPPLAGATRLVADFVGAGLRDLRRDSGVVARVTLDRGTPLSIAAYPVVGQPGRWRLIVEVADGGEAPLNLRAFLQRGTVALSETLVYQFLGKRDRGS